MMQVLVLCNTFTQGTHQVAPWCACLPGTYHRLYIKKGHTLNLCGWLCATFETVNDYYN